MEEMNPKIFQSFKIIPQILSFMETLWGKFNLKGSPPNNGYFSGQQLRAGWKWPKNKSYTMAHLFSWCKSNLQFSIIELMDNHLILEYILK